MTLTLRHQLSNRSPGPQPRPRHGPGLTSSRRGLLALLALLGPLGSGIGPNPATAGAAPSPIDPATGEASALPAGPDARFETQAVANAPMLNIAGKGFGHGRGMGQWGALGYTTAWRIPYPVVLDHFYGGTSAGIVNSDFDIKVRLNAHDNKPFVVAADAGNLMTSITGNEKYRTVLFQPEPDGRWTVWAGGDCAGSWGWWAVGQTTGQVKFWIDGADQAAQDRSQWFAMCTSDGLRYYRGTGETVRTPVRTGVVNNVNVELYLRAVVPREMPASWGDREWPWGIQALAAQAVAARSYVLTEERAPSYWHTCDYAACQVYGGAATWDPVNGGRLLEDARSNEAVINTRGEVRVRPDGSTARTEYSASTGGHTAGGAFPAVVDQGDPLPDNPNYRWTYQVSAKALQDAFPTIGTLTKITVTGRNGLGEWGGRVTEVRLEGTTGVAVTDGDTVNFYLGLGTDWFDVLSLTSGTG
ncbi:MAG: SpoIID/LytB domain-containing protein [Acidimicrobiales bacterium]